MDYKRASKGLGLLSLMFAVTELFAPRRITKALGATGHEGLVKGFGVRELAAGVGILRAPAHSMAIWNRVVGDSMDLAALGAAARSTPRSKAVWGALAFIAAITALDVIVARGLDRTTGRTLPGRA